MEPSISPGTVLWVPLQRGGDLPRPAVALSAPNSEGRFTVVAGSRQSYDPDLEVELPSDPNRPNGHPRTRLKQRTFATVDWIEEISVSDVCEIKGAIPATTLEQIWDKIRQTPPTPSKPPP